MAVRLENLTDRPVLLPLASGESLRLSPRDTSEPLEDHEVQASTRVEKLVAQGVITVHGPSKRAGATTPKNTTGSKGGEKSAEGAKKTTG